MAVMDMLNRFDYEQKLRSRRMRMISLILATVMLFAVGLAVHPAFTAERVLNCIQTEHTHTEECYVFEGVPVSLRLSCDAGGHTHNEDCVDEGGVVICGKSDSVIHIHNDYCYAEKELVCTLSEKTGEAHSHSDACYTDGVLSCGKSEISAHNYSESCVDASAPAQKSVLSCTTAEHTHGDSCYVLKDEAVKSESDSIISSVTPAVSGSDVSSTDTGEMGMLFSTLLLSDAAEPNVLAATEPQSGICGTNATWTYADGVLTISGTGEMANNNSKDTPWYSIRESITEVVIEDGITYTGWHAFKDCTSLESVSIADSVTQIGSHTFSNCTSLEFIDIPDGVTTIGNNVFTNCTSLKSIVIPDGVKEIETSLFYNCKSLTSVEIPDTVTDINQYAFYNCKSLQYIDLPDDITFIGTQAFYYCTALKSINIPAAVKTINQDAFSACSALDDIYITDLAAWCNIKFSDYDSNPLYNGEICI